MLLIAVEVYRRETYSIIQLFLGEGITFPSCVSCSEADPQNSRNYAY
jgi:hypothetical protein